MENKAVGHTEEHQTLIRGLALETLSGEEKRRAERNLLSCAECLKEYNAQREWVGLMSDSAYVEPWERYLQEKNPRRYDLYNRVVERLSADQPEEGVHSPEIKPGYWFSVRAWRSLAFALASLLAVIMLTALYQRITFRRELSDRTAYYQNSLAEQERQRQSAIQDQRRIEAKVGELAQQNHQQAGTIEDLSRRLEKLLQPSLNAIATVQFFTKRGSGKVPEITRPKEQLFFNFEIRVAEEFEYQSYNISIVDNSGKVIWQSDRARKDELDNFSLLIEKSFLQPGSYTLKLYGIEHGRPRLIAQNPFRIKP